MRRYFILGTKKCRIYAACGVSQTPIIKRNGKEIKAETNIGKEKYSYTDNYSEDGEYFYEVQMNDYRSSGERDQDLSYYVVKESEKIIYDSQAPEITVEYSAGGKKVEPKTSGKSIYNNTVTATVRIKETNLKTDDIVTETTGTRISGWNKVEEGYYAAEYEFATDGVHRLSVSCTDMVGHTSGEPVNASFTVDKTAPGITIEYDNNHSANDLYYSAARTATVTVTDANFDSSCDIEFDIDTDGSTPQITDWKHIAGEGCMGADGHAGDCKYVCTVRFFGEGEYRFQFSCTDKAGNKSSVEDGGHFIIDTIAPEVAVVYDNNDVRNEKYYSTARTASITIKEASFSEKLVTIEALRSEGVMKLPAAGSWSNVGDEHTVTISFAQDGIYGFRVVCSDLAENVSKEYVSDVFIIDTAAPEIVFGGVQNNSANRGVVAPTVRYTDTNLDEVNTLITLSGTNHGVMADNAQKSVTKSAVQLIYPDFEHIQEMDDFYTLKVKAVDLAGNETENELNFSVNRFGSTYRISADTQSLIDAYYTGKAPVITVTEINIDELEYGEVTVSGEGQTTTLRRGSDYSVEKEGADENWKSYTYSIKASNFNTDGIYSVALYSVDKAENTSDNRMKGQEITFALDTTAPSIVADGIESGNTYKETSRDITIDVKDNMYLTGLCVTDNAKTVLEMSAEELADNGGIVSFALNESEELRDIVITATDIVNNEQRLEYNDVLITTKADRLQEIEAAKMALADKPAAGADTAAKTEDDKLLYAVILIMSCAVLLTAGVVYFRKRYKKM